MDSINFVAITGIVSGLSFNADTVRKRPVIQMTAYLPSLEKWTSQIYVVFCGDGRAKRSQAITEGDIIVVFGALSHDGTKVCVYCDSFVHLVSNQKPEQEFFQRPTLMCMSAVPNRILILGKVAQLTERYASIKTGKPFLIDGEPSSDLLAPVTISNGHDVKLGDTVIFTGDFTDDGVVGNAIVIKEGRSADSTEDFV